MSPCWKRGQAFTQLTLGNLTLGEAEIPRRTRDPILHQQLPGSCCCILAPHMLSQCITAQQTNKQQQQTNKTNKQTKIGGVFDYSSPMRGSYRASLGRLTRSLWTLNPYRKRRRGRGGGGGEERETETETETERDIQTDRQTETETDRERHRQTQRETDRDRDRGGVERREKETETETERDDRER